MAIMGGLAHVLLGFLSLTHVMHRTHRLKRFAGDSFCADLVANLVAAGANVNAKKAKNGCTALHQAAFKGKAKTVAALLASGANPDAKFVFSAFLFCHLICIETEPDHTLRAKEASWKMTPLHKATWNGHVTVVKMLLEASASKEKALDARTSCLEADGSTALHIAVSQGHGNVVRLLLAEGALLDARDDDGATPVEIASAEMVKILKASRREAGAGAGAAAGATGGAAPIAEES